MIKEIDASDPDYIFDNVIAPIKKRYPMSLQTKDGIKEIAKTGGKILFGLLFVGFGVTSASRYNALGTIIGCLLVYYTVREWIRYKYV